MMLSNVANENAIKTVDQCRSSCMLVAYYYVYHYLIYRIRAILIICEYAKSTSFVAAGLVVRTCDGSFVGMQCRGSSKHAFRGKACQRLANLGNVSPA